MLNHASRALLCFALFSLPAIAHDYWLERQDDAYVLLQGHRHSTHSGAERVTYDPTIVKEVYCLDASAKARKIAVQGNPVRIQTDCHALNLRIVSGYWTKTPWDTVNLPKNEVKGALESWYAEEGLQHIVRWTPALSRPPATAPGLSLRLLNDPATLQVGDKFVVFAALDGTARAGVTVAYDGQARGTTDSDGRINLRLRHGGRQAISASLETPLTDGRADSHLRATSLGFHAP